jgi:hypothetical protein
MKKASKPGAKRVTRATRSRKPSTGKEPKRTAKGGQEKQSISRQQQQREKEGAGAETGASVSNIPVSQTSDEKAAINPAKREEANDEVASQKKEAEQSRSREILDFCEGVKERIKALLILSENGDQLALFNLVGIVAETTHAINAIASVRPELARPLAQISLGWPAVISRKKAHREEMRTLIDKIQLGTKSICNGASQLDKPATKIAFQLYLLLQENQPSLQLPPLTTETWDVWFRAGWEMLLWTTNRHPEKDESLREIGRHYGQHSKNSGQQEKVTPATREANIRAGIRKQLRQSFKLILGRLSRQD